MFTYSAFIAVSVILAVLFETSTLLCGELKGYDTSSEFVVTTIMELLTICVIPMSLRLFKFRKVLCRLTSEESLLRWALLRMLLLCVPMVVNTLLYYLYMNVAFGYMAIVLFLCLAFVVPTKARCEWEVGMGRRAAGDEE